MGGGVGEVAQGVRARGEMGVVPSFGLLKILTTGLIWLVTRGGGRRGGGGPGRGEMGGARKGTLVFWPPLKS